MMKVPPGFAVLSPYMTVADADVFISFLKKAFGAVEVSRSLEGKRIRHAEVEISGCHFMLGQPADPKEARPSDYYLYVGDADIAVRTALAAGGKLILEVQDMPYGDRQGGIEDQFGNRWWVSQRLVNGAYTQS